MNKERIAFITGASEGVGRSIAINLAKKNICLYLLSRSKKKLIKLRNQIKKNYGNEKIVIIPFNMEKKFSKNILNICKKNLGMPDILVHNSGGPKPGNFSKISKIMWEKTVNRNLLSVIDLTTLFSKNMIKKNWGRIITISSTVAKYPTPNMVQSATIRSAVLAFNKSISFDLAKHNITNNNILLGGVETSRLKNLIKINSRKNKTSFDKYKKKLVKNIPAGRFADPDEIAKLVNYLISKDGDYINGQSIVIDGGMSKSV
tara:strand:- start:6810 stop:7589 length:780 start_codon:yes stop_codon:yes gene_type:complete